MHFIIFVYTYRQGFQKPAKIYLVYIQITTVITNTIKQVNKKMFPFEIVLLPSSC